MPAWPEIADIVNAHVPSTRQNMAVNVLMSMHESLVNIMPNGCWPEKETFATIILES